MISLYEIYLIFQIIKFYIQIKINNLFNISNINTYQSICSTLKNNGPLFVKLGQILSSKNVNLDSEFIYELNKLKEESITYNHNIYDIEKKYNITQLEYYPIAGGSIANVYVGIYKGQKVIIKLCHENILEKAKKNIKDINNLISNYSNCFDILKKIQEVVDLDFYYKEILSQCDLRNEVQNMNILKKDLYKIKSLQTLIEFPKIYEYDHNFLIESYCDGQHYKKFIKDRPQKTCELFSLLTCLSNVQFRECDIFHGDLHDSNFFVKTNEKNDVFLQLIDFGIKCHMDDEMKKNMKIIYRTDGVISGNNFINYVIEHIKKYNEKEKYEKMLKQIQKETIEIKKRLKEIAERPHFLFTKNHWFPYWSNNLPQPDFGMYKLINKIHQHRLKAMGEMCMFINTWMFFSDIGHYILNHLHNKNGFDICNNMENQIIARYYNKKYNKRDSYKKEKIVSEYLRNYFIKKKLYNIEMIESEKNKK